MLLPEISLDVVQDFAREYGYWTILGGIMLENMGIPLPGETIVLVGGFLSGSGEMRFAIVLGCAILGATLGDNFGYWLGRLGGWPLLLKIGEFFKLDVTQLEDLRNRFSCNAPRAVFLGRFVALLRIFAGPLAGISQMPYGQFLLCNVAGAALWAGVMVSLAYFAGRLVSLETLVSWVAQFSLLALAGLGAWVAFSAWRHRRGVQQTVVPSSDSSSI
ncbi:DedA family protein [Thermosynechococcaceae cyanobacterium BACA0444]|uniref:DedA family protein n=1 Tax=Pseudocalidococcus azoricus BACA0444 TaxID=2918990 RepID=A0AAE4FSZ0_9CYAN|nr:DedA family protein [Pseudocalidococcus azoricus]MDS3860395.1 DedA family protein [Pseudocalidococcus azoricus BACA0444]